MQVKYMIKAEEKNITVKNLDFYELQCLIYYSAKNVMIRENIRKKRAIILFVSDVVCVRKILHRSLIRMEKR